VLPALRSDGAAYQMISKLLMLRPVVSPVQRHCPAAAVSDDVFQRPTAASHPEQLLKASVRHP
jgi:hypothetical protein